MPETEQGGKVSNICRKLPVIVLSNESVKTMRLAELCK